MSNPKVYAQLTDLYTNIVQRVIHYQKMAESSSRDNKIDTVFHQLIEEEKAHLKTLGSVIIELLSEQETSKQKDSLLSSTLPAELMLLAEQKKKSVENQPHKPIPMPIDVNPSSEPIEKEKQSQRLQTETSPVTPVKTKDSDITNNDIHHESKQTLIAKKKKEPLVWKFN